MQFSVFGISGLRGIVGKELTPEAISRVAAAFGALIGPGTVVVGRDTRPSGAMLEAAATAGLLSVGRNVELLGVCPTPTVLHHTRQKERAAAIVITASHNHEEWNGLKFAGASGRFLSPAELERFRQFAEAGNFTRAEWHNVGRVAEYADAIADHLRSITGSELFAGVRQRLSGRKLAVGIDAVNGAAADAAVRLVEEFGCRPVRLNCETSAEVLAAGFPRKPEPVPENLALLRRLVLVEKLDLGLAYDPDGDRLSCIDETGFALGEEATICLAAKYVLTHRKGPVVVNLSTTRGVEEVCGDFRAPVLRAPVGEAAVVERMLESGSVLGGEGNGGVILPEVNFTRDGLVAAATILGLIATTGQPLSALRAELPQYRMAKTTLDLPRDEFESRRSRLLEEFSGCRLDERDGLKFDGPDFWVHVRASNTEPLVRLIAEARDEATLHTILARARKTLGG